MRSEVRFAALLAYSPRGQSDISQRSRGVCYSIKEGNPQALAQVGRRLTDQVTTGGALSAFFGPDITLVPMPRSAPLVQGALWPAERICQAITNANLAAAVAPALERAAAVPRSSRAAPGERPTSTRHYESFVAHARVDVGPRILLVDDVVTKGATALAAVSRLEECYPHAQIIVFAAIRTMGLVPEIDRILDPVTGIIRLVGGEPIREP